MLLLSSCSAFLLKCSFSLKVLSNQLPLLEQQKDDCASLTQCANICCYACSSSNVFVGHVHKLSPNIVAIIPSHPIYNTC